MEYTSTIGLEIHTQLATKSKMFCRCNNDAEDKAPNTVVCPLCMGFPGTLPVTNKQAVEWGTKVALALGCKINLFQRFDRKNYFYPDLPKGYQISQFFFPVGENGKLLIDYLADDKRTKKEFTVGITRLHLEEDAGKSIHASNATLVDFNRCGTPLMEIVTEPDITSPEEARIFMQELQRLVRLMGVSHADMEKGHLRVDANISVRPKGQKELGTKVEVKNLNSFKYLEQALKFEIDRQIKILESGGVVEQETRGWDSKTNTSISQRSKEGSIDYRYFPEPDLPPVVLTEAEVNSWKKDLTMLPRELREKSEKFKLSYDRVTELQGKDALLGFVKLMEQDSSLDPKAVANWPNADLAFYQWIMKQEPTSAAIKQVYTAINSGVKLTDAIKQIRTISVGELESTIKTVLSENAQAVAKHQAGETKIIGFLIGQVMNKTKGSADPDQIKDMVSRLLTK
ncbi:Asp-tRNA(Asn)/Glu-tRNA(Gln) amidotransferase subunit GatB [Patescibacteria group bacterium]|nr:Asp-tRNA(Asn)/Glu-tRNA(Gln) amidotransferase subunit GatB [Patescibacteria group bacterium]